MANNKIIDAIKSAEFIVHKLLEIKPGEEVVLVGDPDTDIEMMQALAGVIQGAGAEYNMVVMPNRPPEASLSMTRFIEKGLEAADVIIGMTRSSAAACYSDAVEVQRKARGLRQLSMVMRDIDTLTKGGATADYEAMMLDAEQLRQAWTGAKRIHLTSPAGTDLTAELGVVEPFIECGFANQPGGEAAFTDGEVSLGVREGTAQGVVVIDGPAAYIGQPATPLKLTFKDGRLVDIAGDMRTGRALQDIVHKIKDADNFAEIGIGVNPACRKLGVFQEEKKAYGSVHIAIGRNCGVYGGTVAAQIHIDMVFYNGTVTTDKGVLLKDGRLAFKDQ